MGILDALTGNASKAATKKGVAALTAAQAGARTDAFAGRDSANSLLSDQRAYSENGVDRAQDELRRGATSATGLLDRAGAVYDPLVKGGGDAFARLLDATGANGAAGSDAATAAFRSAPGYEYERDEALGAVQRAAGARGDLAGGNATKDLLTTATGLADKSWQGYISNLSGLMGAYGQGLAGKAGALTGEAGVASGLGTGLASAELTGTAADNALVSKAADNWMNTGTTVGNQGINVAGSISNTLQAGAKAAEQASANVLGLGANLIGGVSNFVGGNGIANLTKLFA